jgi:hypothetical protein
MVWHIAVRLAFSTSPCPLQRRGFQHFALLLAFWLTLGFDFQVIMHVNILQIREICQITLCSLVFTYAPSANASDPYQA